MTSSKREMAQSTQQKALLVFSPSISWALHETKRPSLPSWFWSWCQRSSDGISTLRLLSRCLLITPGWCTYENATQQITWIWNIDLQQNLKISGFPVVVSLQALPHRQIFVSLVTLNLKRAASDYGPHSQASENALYKSLVAGQPWLLHLSYIW